MESILSFLDALFGIETEDLNTLQILARTPVIYIIGIALVRIGNKRFVGKMTAFDFILAIIIGSLLSRAITESELFLKVIPATLLLIIIHWIFSYISAQSGGIGDLIKGTERVIVKDGEILWEALQKSHLSERDLMQALRLNAGISDISRVRMARLERNGDISFILQEDEK